MRRVYSSGLAGDAMMCPSSPSPIAMGWLWQAVASHGDRFGMRERKTEDMKCANSAKLCTTSLIKLSLHIAHLLPTGLCDVRLSSAFWLIRDSRSVRHLATIAVASQSQSEPNPPSSLISPQYPSYSRVDLTIE